MNIAGSRILVTGGAGFIGSHIVDSLVAQGAELTIYDNFSSGYRDNIRAHDSKITVIEGDIRDYPALEKASEGMDIISHQAAQLEIFLASKMPEKDLEINTIGTLNVLRASLKNRVKKVINASSACVYGQVDKPSREDDAPSPNWAYGVSKLAAEKYAQIYNDYEGLPVVSLRYGIVYGEREWYRRVLPIFLKRVIEGLPPVVFGHGRQIRDFIYVKDLVKCHNLCIENDTVNGQIFNVASGIPTTIVELAQTSVELSDIPLTIEREEIGEGEVSSRVEGKKRNTAELQTMLLDIGKARRMLNWEPVVPLREGLRNEMLWAASNLNRWNEIRYTV